MREREKGQNEDKRKKEIEGGWKNERGEESKTEKERMKKKRMI